MTPNYILCIYTKLKAKFHPNFSHWKNHAIGLHKGRLRRHPQPSPSTEDTGCEKARWGAALGRRKTLTKISFFMAQHPNILKTIKVLSVPHQELWSHGYLPKPDLDRDGLRSYQNGVICAVGVQTSLTCPPTRVLPPSLPGGARFFKGHSSCFVVSGSSNQQCRDNRNRNAS